MNQPLSPQPPQPPQPPYPPVDILPTSGLAIASLVTGIMGFAGPVVFSIIALVTGYAARNETRSRPPRASGDGLATAGIVMGYVQLGLVAFVLCCVLASLVIPGLGFLSIFGRG